MEYKEVMFRIIFYLLLSPLKAPVVLSFEECCTEHPTLRLIGRSSTPGSDQDWDVYATNDKEVCMDGCLAKPNCVASMLDESDNKCYEYYQMPRQDYEDTDPVTAFLCRTRALQVCAKHARWRTHTAGNGYHTHFPKAGDVYDDETCLQKCKSANQAQYATIWSDPNCFCYLTVPSISLQSSLHGYICSNPIVSCKAKNALRRSERECERFDKLRLFQGYGLNDNLVPAQIDHSGESKETCMQLCLDHSDCLAVSYYEPGGQCHEYNGGIPGQFPQPDGNYITYLCA